MDHSSRLSWRCRFRSGEVPKVYSNIFSIPQYRWFLEGCWRNKNSIWNEPDSDSTFASLSLIYFNRHDLQKEVPKNLLILGERLQAIHLGEWLSSSNFRQSVEIPGEQSFDVFIRFLFFFFFFQLYTINYWQNCMHLWASINAHRSFRRESR